MNKRPLFLALGLLLAGLWLSSFQVAEGQLAIVTRFGKPVNTVEEAGLQWKLPSPIDSVVYINMRKHLLDMPEGEYLTGDKKNLLVNTFMVWSVADPLKYYKTLGARSGAEARLRETLGSAVSGVISSFEFDQILGSGEAESGLARVGALLLEQTRARAADSFGIEIHDARVKRLNFPDQNKRSVFTRMEAERQAISEGFRASGREQYDKIKAETDREEAKLLAEARRKAAEVRGAAQAEAARLYADAYSKDPELYKMLRSLEAAEKALSGEGVMIMPSDHPLLQVLQDMPQVTGQSSSDND